MHDVLTKRKPVSFEGMTSNRWNAGFPALAWKPRIRTRALDACHADYLGRAREKQVLLQPGSYEASTQADP